MQGDTHYCRCSKIDIKLRETRDAAIQKQRQTHRDKQTKKQPTRQSEKSSDTDRTADTETEDDDALVCSGA